MCFKHKYEFYNRNTDETFFLTIEDILNSGVPMDPETGEDLELFGDAIEFYIVLGSQASDGDEPPVQNLIGPFETEEDASRYVDQNPETKGFFDNFGYRIVPISNPIDFLEFREE